MLMRVAKRWDQRFSTKVDHLCSRILFRKLVSHVCDPSLVLYEVFCNVVRRVNCKYISFVNFHFDHLTDVISIKW